VYHPLLLAAQQPPGATAASGGAPAKQNGNLAVMSLEPRLAELLQQVEAGLGAAVRKGQVCVCVGTPITVLIM